MDGMNMVPPPSMGMVNTTAMPRMHKMMMHMTFFWGKKAEILFSGWPGSHSGVYWLALVVIFAMAVLVEWLSYCRIIKDGSNRVAAGLIQTLMHAIRVGLAYMVMLGVMSFNGGVFLAAVAGHAVGFLFFGSRVFRQPLVPLPYEKSSDLPPMSC
ncbi:hypothetical protein NMG60_11034128 [Bertholletia excelsa]